MDEIVITGAGPLKGETFASGAKNAALPILASSLLAVCTAHTIASMLPNTSRAVTSRESSPIARAKDPSLKSSMMMPRIDAWSA